MPLPQIDIPIYEIFLISANSKINYRPFLVKEKKILMAAAESKDPNAAYLAVKQIVNNCTFGKIDVENLALFDLQYLFLKIRSKSIGEIAEFKFECPSCRKDVNNAINFDEVQIKKDPDHTRKIMLTDKIGIMMKYPNMQLEKIIQDSNENAQELDSKILISCIDYVFDENEVYYAKTTPQEELNNLIDSLTEQQLKKIMKFFEMLPKLEHEINYVCQNCKHQGNYLVRDLYGFFD